jgi:hypothetical protein
MKRTLTIAEFDHFVTRSFAREHQASPDLPYRGAKSPSTPELNAIPCVTLIRPVNVNIPFDESRTFSERKGYDWPFLRTASKRTNAREGLVQGFGVGVMGFEFPIIISQA